MSLLSVGKTVGISLGLAVILSAVPGWAQSGRLEGKAIGENGDVLVGYIVEIDRQSIKGNYKTKTNKKGEYVYIGLPIGDYKVTLKTPEGAHIVTIGTRITMGDDPPINFDIAKEKAYQAEQEKKKIEADPKLKAQVEEQAKETKNYTSLKELFDESMRLMDQKMYAEAIPLLEQALPMAKAANIPIVLARLGESYHKTKNYEKALDNYQRAIAANPAEASYLNNVGNIYADMGKSAEAAAAFQKAAEVDPARASSYYYNYGAVMYNTGKMDEAVGAFQKAVAINPAFADGQFMLGRALMGKLDLDPKTGKIIAAPGTVEALEAYLKLEPQGKYAGDAQSMLQTVQGGVETTYKKEKKKSKS